METPLTYSNIIIENCSNHIIDGSVILNGWFKVLFCYDSKRLSIISTSLSRTHDLHFGHLGSNWQYQICQGIKKALSNQPSTIK